MNKGGSRLAPLLSALVPVVTECHFSFDYRLGSHSLLHKSVKDKPAAAGITPIEPECKLLQIRLEVGRDKRTLMGAQYPALEEACNPMYTWHRNMSGIA